MDLYGKANKSYFSGNGLKIEHFKRHSHVIKKFFPEADESIYGIIRNKIPDHQVSIFKPLKDADISGVVGGINPNQGRAVVFGVEKASEDEEDSWDIMSCKDESFDEMNGLCTSLRDNYKAIVITMAHFADNIKFHLKKSSSLRKENETHTIMKIFTTFSALGEAKDFGFIKPAGGKVTKARIAENLNMNADTKTHQDHITIIIKACLNIAILKTMSQIPGSSKILSRYYSPLEDALVYDFFRDFNRLLRTMNIDIFDGVEVNERNCLSIIKSDHKLNDHKFNVRNILALENRDPEMWLNHASAMDKYNIGKETTYEPVLVKYRDGFVQNALQIINEVSCFKGSLNPLPYGVIEYNLIQDLFSGVIKIDSFDAVAFLRDIYEHMDKHKQLFMPKRLNFMSIETPDEPSKELKNYLNKLVDMRESKVLGEFIEEYKKLNWRNSIDYQSKEILSTRLKRGSDESGIITYAGSVQLFNEKVVYEGEIIEWGFYITQDRGILGLSDKKEVSTVAIYPEIDKHGRMVVKQ